MECPVCKDTVLAMTDRQGIEIDTCPRCRGIWLDRGELDRLIERAERADAPAPPPVPQAQPGHAAPYPPRQHHPYPPQAQYPPQAPYRKKHKSLLGELFDF